MELDRTTQTQTAAADQTSSTAFYEVLPYLYVGDATALQSLPILHVHNITTVIIVRSNVAQQPFLPSFQQSFVYHIVGEQGEDEASTLTLLARSCAQVIESERSKQARKVFVYDEAGQDRAAAVVICYLIEVHGLSMVRAMEHMHICQPSLLLSSELFRYCREFEIVCHTVRPSAPPVSSESTTIRHKRSLDEVTDVDSFRTHKQAMLSSKVTSNGDDCSMSVAIS